MLKSESDNDEKKQKKDGAANNDATANDKLDSSSGKNQLIRGLLQGTLLDKILCRKRF